MEEEKRSDSKEQEPGPDNEPQIYRPQSSSKGWKFSRRDFLTVAAAAAVGAVIGGGIGAKPVIARMVGLTGQSSEPPLSELKAGQSFTKSWTFKNIGSEPWGRDASLTLATSPGGGQPLTITLPNLAPGQATTVSAPMLTPPTLEPSTIEASIHITGADYKVYLPYIAGPPPPPPCTCDSDVGCTCDSHSGCTCVGDVPCACDIDIPCACDYHVCVCEYDVPCTCDYHFCDCEYYTPPCTCDYHIPCACEFYSPPCSCDYHIPCACEFYNPCGCVYYF